MSPTKVAYLLCIALVVTFMLFEVLDVDGSDLTVTGTSVLAPGSEVSTDLKRCLPNRHLPTVTAAIEPVARAGVPAVEGPALRRTAPWPFATALARGYRIPLARGVLPGPASLVSRPLVTA